MITVTVDRESDLTIFSAKGSLSAFEVRRAIDQFYQGKVTRNVLWDLSDCDLSGIRSADVQNLAEIPRSQLDTRRGGKTALVAAAGLAFGLSRMYEQHTSAKDLPFETMTFHNLEDARRWLETTR